MAQRKNKSSRLARKVKRRVIKGIIIPLILLMFAYVFVSAVDYFDINVGFDLDLQGYGIFELFSPNDSGKEEETSMQKPPIVTEGDEVAFHFIDVGQGDAILITTAEGNILIDTSEKSEREALVGYLAEQNITSLKYLILTHTDADHIGSADYVVENYDVENVMMTDYDNVTTNTYQRLLAAIDHKGTNVIIPELRYTFTLGALQMTVVGPAEKINDPNEMSLVIKAVHGETSVMFTGDAESKSEAAILKHWSAADLQVDILKVGHHGSSSSTTDEFLAALSPTAAVISCGEGNDHGHPHEEIVDKLTEKGVTIYRTDKDGTIVIISDGTEWRVVEQ
ncbi:MAG: MBL fold metallo-hydrolase [Ruminococcaceae bacterium]|nr:MBL fold metallo-hydrolase [Oscillospiraceae bacterium]